MAEQPKPSPMKPRGKMARLRASVDLADSAMRARTERAQRFTPPPPPLRAVLEQALTLGGLPLLAVRLFWYNLRELRFWWPVVLPLLAWTAWRTYRQERLKDMLRDRNA